MYSNLVSCNYIALILYGSSSQQRFPMSSSSFMIESTAQEQYLSSSANVIAIQFWIPNIIRLCVYHISSIAYYGRPYITNRTVYGFRNKRTWFYILVLLNAYSTLKISVGMKCIRRQMNSSGFNQNAYTRILMMNYTRHLFRLNNLLCESNPRHRDASFGKYAQYYLPH